MFSNVIFSRFVTLSSLGTFTDDPKTQQEKPEKPEKPERATSDVIALMNTKKEEEPL